MAFEDTYRKINIVNYILKLVTSKVTKVRIDYTFLCNYLMYSQITIKLEV